MVAAFADLLGLATEGRRPPPPTDPRQRRELILGALVGQLESLARRQPVLFIFEDAHWADSTSLELLERVAERVRRLPMLMILTHRPDFEPPWTGESQVTSLMLSRLARRDSAALTERVAGGKPLPTEILDRVVEHTDGIPLFIEELTKSLLEGGLLQEEDGRYVLADAMPALVIPSSLQDSLMARLDRLAPVKEVVQIGAAIGREFSYVVLEAVARRPPDQLRDALDQLSRAGLIFRRGMPPDDVFVFKHAFVQDAAYDALLRGRRQELHAAIATFLDRHNASLAAGENAALLAHHWIGAEDWEKALHYTLEAAEHANALYARTEAVNHYWQALDLFERLPENSDRSRVHARVLLSTMLLPGFVRDDAARARMLRPCRSRSRKCDAAEAVNWSAVAQRAFREAIFTHFVRKDHSDMEKVIERLRASKERFETKQFAAGKEAGSKWAKTDAEYYELAAVAAFDAEAHEHSDIGPDDLQQVIDPDGETLPHEWAEFWENHYGRGTPSGAFIRGFMKGATEIHDEIADQL